MEIGVACATMGLVLASLMGGPIAKILITRNKLEPAEIVQPDIGIPHKAFIIIPLVSGFFVDIANAIVIKRFIVWFG
jgi:Na+/glutamate symporter